MSQVRTRLFVLVFVVASLASWAVQVTQAHGEQPPAAPAKKQAVVVTVALLEIEGMVSPSCPVLLRKALENVEGVVRVQASAETKLAEISFDARRVSVERIRAIIKERVGFESRVKRGSETARRI
jgi:copper chaperone CopZ